MPKTIISVGFQIPGFSEQCFEHSSDQSLLDADVIIFQPEEFLKPEDGSKPRFSEGEAFSVRQNTEHWKGELTTALTCGKTVFLILKRRQIASVPTGKKEIRGVRAVVEYVEDYSNYRFLPIELPQIISKSGSAIVFKGNPLFAAFWTEFKDSLQFESYLTESIGDPIFVTKTGEKLVGGIVSIGGGHLVILPSIVYDEAKFLKKVKGEYEWTPEASKFGNRLVTALLGIDKGLGLGSGRTPPPAWLDAPEFISPTCLRMAEGISDTSKQIESLVEKKSALLVQLEEERQLNDLLFETGKRLESAVTKALKILGYSAGNYNDGELELDQVIVSPEGHRFIGECEGKDRTAINIDKFRQLEENIQTDLQREDVETPAIGILFGNGFRLTPPEQRSEQFTKKCLASAKRGTILVRTTDLYPVVRYLQENDDKEYARQCRGSIANAAGSIVSFPEKPKT